MEWTNARVDAKFQRIKDVIVYEEFPRNVAGKTLKREMRQTYHHDRGGGGEAAGGRRRGKETVAWLILFLAGLLEVGWAIGLKYTEGFSRLGSQHLDRPAMVASLGLLGIALKSPPVGTAYAV
ncbi:MAG: SMR family transporter [Rhodospirillales bacterium]